MVRIRNLVWACGWLASVVCGVGGHALLAAFESFCGTASQPADRLALHALCGNTCAQMSELISLVQGQGAAAQLSCARVLISRYKRYITPNP